MIVSCVVYWFYVELKQFCFTLNENLGFYITNEMGSDFQSELKIRGEFERGSNLEGNLTKLKKLAFCKFVILGTCIRQ